MIIRIALGVVSPKSFRVRFLFRLAIFWESVRSYFSRFLTTFLLSFYCSHARGILCGIHTSCIRPPFPIDYAGALGEMANGRSVAIDRLLGRPQNKINTPLLLLFSSPLLSLVSSLLIPSGRYEWDGAL